MCRSMLNECIDRILVRPSCTKSENLAADVRAAFCRLMIHIHVNRDPQEEVTRIKYARLWNQVKSNISLHESVIG
jgi:inositol 1,4,5-triphosphate receptor type 1